MGAYSGTPEGQVQLYRCGNMKFPGCGKILTEGQKQRHGMCPYCGSRGSTTYYPRNLWQKIKAYGLLIKTGELIEWGESDVQKQPQTGSSQEKS